MKTQTNLLMWKHKAVSLISLTWNQIRMGSTLDRSNFARCCGFVHVKTLAVLIALFEIVYIVYQGLLAVSLFLCESQDHTLSAALYTMVITLATIAVVLHLIGIGKQTPTLLIPHMLMQVLFILTLFILAMFSFYALLVGTSVNINLTLEAIPPADKSAPRPVSLIPIPKIQRALISKLLIGTLVLVAVAYTILALLNFWCFNVVLDCYRWLTFQLAEKANLLDQNTSSVPNPVIAETGKSNNVTVEP